MTAGSRLVVEHMSTDLMRASSSAVHSATVGLGTMASREV